ncbi:MAG TPA: ABC transporter permease [Pyrinomonadaceae bacterium]|nr:ABC transporter permease [Pyrinomonadaceae bacterium]
MSETSVITRIEPSRAWLGLGLGDLWRYRELLYFLTWRDVKVRYKQTAIGVFWAVLQPALTTVIFAVVFSQVARFESKSLPYPLYVLSGMLPWLFVYNAITFAANSLVGNTNLVTKVYFPRLIVPLAAVLAGLIDLALGFLILVGVMFWYGVHLTAQIALTPLFLLLSVLVALAFGTLFSALNVRFRDVKFALPFVLQVCMFVSPIFYPLDILSERARFVIALNPLTGVLHGFRASLFGEQFNSQVIAISLIGTILLLILSLFVFRNMEDSFADEI